VRWVIESDTAPDLLTWPEEFDDFLNALARDFRAERVTCDPNVETGAMSARFVVAAEGQASAESLARDILVDALAGAGFRLPDEPLAYLGATPTRALDSTSPRVA
jgi:hypothetical protein